MKLRREPTHVATPGLEPPSSGIIDIETGMLLGVVARDRQPTEPLDRAGVVDEVPGHSRRPQR